MSLLPAIHATIEISKVMIPPIVIGFFIASVIRSSPYFRYLSLPTARLASIANLSQECSAALTLFLVNNWAALAALSEVHKRKSITDNELIVAVLVGFIPRGFHGTIFFSVPVAFSVLGIRAGGLYVILDFLANFFIAVAGILAGRLMLKPITMAMIEDENVSTSGTIALVSDGGRAHFIIGFIYYELYVPCETHHDCNSHEFLKPSVC